MTCPEPPPNRKALLLHLHYIQLGNRLSVMNLKAGRQKAKAIGRQLAAIDAQQPRRRRSRPSQGESVSGA